MSDANQVSGRQIRSHGKGIAPMDVDDFRYGEDQDPWTALRDEFEPMPAWLAEYRPGMPFHRKDFLGSRVVYYPGSRTDGQPLRIFGRAHAAHCFVYCDNSLPLTELKNQLEQDNHSSHPRGYHLLTGMRLPTKKLLPRPWIPHFELRGDNIDFASFKPEGGSFIYWSVLERNDEYDDSHGPQRISILHVGREGVETFDALFCQRCRQLPYAVLLHDHGYGGNWTSFGGIKSPLWKMAFESGKKLPKWLLVAEYTHPWPGYLKASGPDGGGMYRTDRYLWRCMQEFQDGQHRREYAYDQLPWFGRS